MTLSNQYQLIGVKLSGEIIPIHSSSNPQTILTLLKNSYGTQPYAKLQMVQVISEIKCNPHQKAGTSNDLREVRT